MRASRSALALVPALLAAVAAGCLSGGGSGDGDAAPDFTLTTLDGDVLSKESLAGRVVVFDAMATYCAPCRASMGHFASFVAAHEGRPVTFVSLDVDPTDRTEDLLPDFRDEFNASWPFAYDTAGLRGKLGIRGIPTVVVIDADGVVREKVEYTRGPLDEDALAARVGPYVEEAERRGR